MSRRDPSRPRRKISAKQRENLKRYAFKKGQSGNPQGNTSERQRDISEAIRLCRSLALRDDVIAEIERLLFDRKNPKIQLLAWELLMTRGFGAPLQSVAIQQQLQIDDLREKAVEPAWDPDSESAIKNAAEVFDKLRELGALPGQAKAIEAPAEPQPVAPIYGKPILVPPKKPNPLLERVPPNREPARIEKFDPSEVK